MGNFFHPRSVPGKGPSRGHFQSATPDGGRQVKCIVGQRRMLGTYLWDFQKEGYFWRHTSFAHLSWLVDLRGLLPMCMSDLCACVCVCWCGCVLTCTLIIGPSSSLDFDSALSSCQPTTFLLCRSHLVSRWQLHGDASHNTAKCTNH